MSITFRRQAAGAGLAVSTALLVTITAAWAGGPPARGKMIAIDKRTGQPAWELTLWTQPGAAIPPVVTDDLVYVLEGGKSLKALNAANGKLRWQIPVASRLPLTLVDNRIVVITDDAAVAYDRWSGKKAWEFSTHAFPEWKFDADTIPVVAPNRLLLPARDTLIAVDPASGQPAWAYTLTRAELPLRPVVKKGMVYLSAGRDESPVALKLEDGLPNTGEYTLPPEMARAMARERDGEASMQHMSIDLTPASTPLRATVAPGGHALAAAGAKKWRFPAPPGWTIDRIAGESAGQVFAVLGAEGGK